MVLRVFSRSLEGARSTLIKIIVTGRSVILSLKKKKKIACMRLAS